MQPGRGLFHTMSQAAPFTVAVTSELVARSPAVVNPVGGQALPTGSNQSFKVNLSRAAGSISTVTLKQGLSEIRFRNSRILTTNLKSGGRRTSSENCRRNRESQHKGHKRTTLRDEREGSEAKGHKDTYATKLARRVNRRRGALERQLASHPLGIKITRRTFTVTRPGALVTVKPWLF